MALKLGISCTEPLSPSRLQSPLTLSKSTVAGSIRGSPQAHSGQAEMLSVCSEHSASGPAAALRSKRVEMGPPSGTWESLSKGVFGRNSSGWGGPGIRPARGQGEVERGAAASEHQFPTSQDCTPELAGEGPASWVGGETMALSVPKCSCSALSSSTPQHFWGKKSREHHRVTSAPCLQMITTQCLKTL